MTQPPSPSRIHPLLARFASGAMWSLLGNVTNRGLLLLAGVLIANWEGKERFGQLGIIQSTAAMFTIFATYGIALTATKFVADLRDQSPLRAGRVITLTSIAAASLGACLSLLLFSFAEPLSAHMLLAPELAPHLRVGSLIVLFGALNDAWNGAWNGLEAFRTASTANLWASIISFPLTLLGTWYFGLLGAVWGWPPLTSSRPRSSSAPSPPR